MQNFEYRNPVKILFGRGQIANIAGEIPEGARILITYGGGSIRANGVYDQVTSLEQYESFARSWNLANTTALKAGHMNTLRAPRLAGDIAGFHDSVHRLRAESLP